MLLSVHKCVLNGVVCIQHVLLLKHYLLQLHRKLMEHINTFLKAQILVNLHGVVNQRIGGKPTNLLWATTILPHAYTRLEFGFSGSK